MSVKSRRNANYTRMFLDLLRSPFINWKAFNKGIIDKHGNVINKPKGIEDDWTRFHQMVAVMKQTMNKAVVNRPELTSLHRKMKIVKEQYNVSVDDTELLNEFPLLSEEMVSGDSGGNPEDIASGVNSGAAVRKNPQTLNKKKVKRKMNEMLNFNEFIQSQEDERIALELAEQKQVEEANKTSVFEFKSIGSNSIMIEATETEIASIVMEGNYVGSIVESELVEAYATGGKDAVHNYIKQTTGKPWKKI